MVMIITKSAKKDMSIKFHKIALIACISLCILFTSSEAALESSDLLESALSMLPENHIIIQLYNKKVDALLKARFKGGLPYYFAGTNYDYILKPRYPQQESGYFKLDRAYLYGFDCKGFTRWVYKEGGLMEHPSLQSILTNNYGKINLQSKYPKKFKDTLHVGDLLVINYGARHVMMYIGTLRDYGAEIYPELDNYLDYPLVIHCGNNPFYYDYYKEHIENKKMRMKVFPPDGGVTVSLLYVDNLDSTLTRKDLRGRNFNYIQIDKSIISFINLDNVIDMKWWRSKDKIVFTSY